MRKFRWRGLGVAIVSPGVCGVGVAALFPEAGLVLFEELDAVDPFGPFPCPELWCDHSARAAVLNGKGFALGVVDEENIVLESFGEREVGGVGVVGVGKDVFGVIVGFGDGGDGGEKDAFEFNVEFGPGGDAVKVGGVGGLFECEELFPGECEWIFAVTIYGEAPLVEGDFGVVTEIEDGPFACCGVCLAWWEGGHAVAVEGAGAEGIFVG